MHQLPGCSFCQPRSRTRLQPPLKDEGRGGGLRQATVQGLQSPGCDSHHFNLRLQLTILTIIAYDVPPFLGLKPSVWHAFGMRKGRKRFRGAVPEPGVPVS